MNPSKCNEALLFGIIKKREKQQLYRLKCADARMPSKRQRTRSNDWNLSLHKNYF